MKTCSHICNEYANLKSIRKIVLFIEGENDELVTKKANVFTKWMTNWNYKIEDLIRFYIKTKLINLERD